MEFGFVSALVLVVVPLGLLALAFAPRRPRRQTTGTLALWRRAARDATASGSRRRWRPPLWLLVAVAGLFAWVVALAQPRALADDREEWLVLVDRRPRMLLPTGDGRTRLEAAVERAVELLRDERGGVRIRWSTPGLPDRVTRSSAPPPVREWLAAPPAARAPAFAAHDEPGALWVLAREPLEQVTDASVVTSGGPAVPGFAAAGADGWSWWEPGADGGALELRPAPEGAGTLVVDAAAPRVLRAFAEVYAGVRGLALVEAADDGTGDAEPRDAEPRNAEVRGAGLADGEPGAIRLVIEAVAGGAPLADGSRVETEDGAVATVSAAFALPPGRGAGRVGALAPRATATGADAVVLTVGDGRVRVAPGAWEPLDDASFAAALGALFDGVLAPDPRVVPAAGRADQGEPVARLRALPDPLPVAFDLRSPLALVAAACFALAGVLRR